MCRVYNTNMGRLIKLYTHFNHDSLYRNSIYLMASTAVMAFFGFFFWILNAHLFTSEQVGIATTLISVMTLISTFSLLGLGNSLIKYLPTSDNKNEYMNTSLTLVGLTSIIISVIYLVFLNIFSPKLLFIRENPIFCFLFVFFIVFCTLNTISENIFIAYRSSVYIFIKNTILSLVKLALPFALIMLGAYGIFMSFGLSITVAFIFSLIIFINRFKYIIKPDIHKNIVKNMAKFTLGSYVADFIRTLPSMILPIIILNTIGAKFSAYFYMDMMIATMLFIIPLSVSQSLFAEGSYSEEELKVHLTRAIRLIAMILLPSVLVTVLFGKYILLTFGTQYSSDGILLLQILAISAIFQSIIYIGNAMLLIKHRIKLIIYINSITAIIILLLSFALTHQNLLGIGISWIIGNMIASGLYVLIWKTNYDHILINQSSLQ
jgi:O-antigen/teichoic acid export membrane protein